MPFSFLRLLCTPLSWTRFPMTIAGLHSLFVDFEFVDSEFVESGSSFLSAGRSRPSSIRFASGLVRETA
ncbi:MAG: hypothetical protein D6826_09040 [Alphaproteobacteria bacterium]|nr:MAG: hypothetical protein D6826_09040 [Alphaproteobacteria bacterium]